MMGQLIVATKRSGLADVPALSFREKLTVFQFPYKVNTKFIQ